MLRIVTFLLILLCATSTTDAQTFLDQLRQTGGQGTVTVTQSKAIDELVNGNHREASAVHTSPKKETVPAQAKHEAEKRVCVTPSPTDPIADIPTVDMRKKVMKNSYKVDGYRVQAFAGGNTRADRQQAERIRTELKMKFPDQPIYVHFYSPRWICRVGNYRTFEEADAMLHQLRKMGYSAATIVKGKITVQY